MQPRPYQIPCHEATVDFIERGAKHGYVVAECSSGKSWLIAWAAEYIVTHGLGRVLVLADRSKLIEQNAAKFSPTTQIGVVSASLKRAEYGHAITIGGIQTVYNKAEQLGHIDWILIDECEAVRNNFDSDSRYHQLLRAYPNARIIGYSATPYTLEDGQIGWGKQIYEITYATLLNGGFCTPITNKIADEPDLSKVPIKGKEFVLEALGAALSDDALVNKTTQKIARYLKQSRVQKTLIFATTAEHAFKIGQVLQACGLQSYVVHGGKTQEQREWAYATFQQPDSGLDILINVELLTKGVDFTCVDCIVCVRPTESMRLWFQILGRAIRLHPGKTRALLLDFSGNLRKFGTLGNPIWKYFGSTKTKVGKALKICPSCEGSVNIGTSQCPECNYVFLKEQVEREIAHEKEADFKSDTTKPHSVERWYNINYIAYSRHPAKNGKHDTLKVSYIAGNAKFYEFKCFDHPQGSWALKQAQLWAKDRGEVPNDVAHALDIKDTWRTPKRICVRPQKGNSKYFEVVGYSWQ